MSLPRVRDLGLKNKLLLAVVLIISVLIPVLFWRSVWFGQPLLPEQIERQLSSPANPREAQHALVVIEQLIRDKDPQADRYYSAVSRLSDHEREEIRTLVAWVMGQDEGSNLFHETLLPMLNDPHPMVRRNAALALVRFNDKTSLPVLRSMLRPHPILAPGEGTMTLEVTRGDWVSANTVVAQLDTGQGVWPLRAQLPSRVLETKVNSGQRVMTDQEIVLVAAPPDHVWEALRALYLIGEAQDIPLVRECVENQNYGLELRQQAERTAKKLEQELATR